MDFWSFRRFKGSWKWGKTKDFIVLTFFLLDEVAEFKTKKEQHVYIKDVPKEAIKRMKSIFDLYDEEKKGCTKNWNNERKIR